MEDAVRIQDGAGLGNNVTHIFPEAITAAVKDALMPDHAVADRLDSDDSVEVVRVGKKRGAASPAPSAPARKKLADGKGESLPVLRLDLGFVPPEELDDALKIHVRDDAKSPHRLYIRRADTNAALIELDPVDPTCAVAQSWVSWIAPPPLTKSQYIRRRDPDAKIVIFSNWQEALSLLMEAFSRNGVRYIRLEGVNGQGKKEGVVKRFQEDPDIAAFLLHTKSQAAGLNLTVARYVFLVEPLLHPSLELQAVARVHRITQTKDTYVYKYAVSDTVDRRVEELRASQSTSLFLASDGGVNAAKESRMVQQTERASAAARKVAKTDELIDDEARPNRPDPSRSTGFPEPITLAPPRSSPHARRRRGAASEWLSAQQQQQLEDEQAEPVAGGSGGSIHAAGDAAQPAALAGIAAAGRAAQQQEEAGLRAFAELGQDATEAEMMDVHAAAAAGPRNE